MALEHEALTERIIGAAIEVHKGLGTGSLESIDENAFAVELRAQDIPFRRQFAVRVIYRGWRSGFVVSTFLFSTVSWSSSRQ